MLYLYSKVISREDISYAIDLSIILNRIYLDYYKEWTLFWRDLLKVLDLYNILNKH